MGELQLASRPLLTADYRGIWCSSGAAIRGVPASGRSVSRGRYLRFLVCAGSMLPTRSTAAKGGGRIGIPGPSRSRDAEWLRHHPLMTF